MNLTLQADYSLRVLILLAARHPRLATIQEIAERYGISKGHLMVVVHKLGTLGFLENIRGRGGGIRLARPPESIGLKEVIVAMEPNFYMVECFNRASNQCLITGCCRLQTVLIEALRAWLGVLERYTLADMVRNNLQLIHLLTSEEKSRPHPRQPEELASFMETLNAQAPATTPGGGSGSGEELS